MIDGKYLDALVIHRMTVSCQRAAFGGKKMTVMSQRGKESFGDNSVFQGNGEILFSIMCPVQASPVCFNIGQIFKKVLIRQS